MQLIFFFYSFWVLQHTQKGLLFLRLLIILCCFQYLWAFLVAQLGRSLQWRDTGDTSWIPGLGRFSGGRNGNPLQYSCLENSVDRGAWRATVHGISKSWKWLSRSKVISFLNLWSIWNLFCVIYGLGINLDFFFYVSPKLSENFLLNNPSSPFEMLFLSYYIHVHIRFNSVFFISVLLICFFQSWINITHS